MKNQLLSVQDHYKELRNRVMFSIAAFLIVLILNILFSDKNLAFILEIGRDAGYTFVSLSPQEVLIQELRIAATLALLATLPIHLWNICAFVAPAFEIKHALLKIASVLASALVMFVVGVTFAYTILLPFALKYLNGIGAGINVLASISVERYTSLFLCLTFGIGLVFEIPVLCILLTKIGLLSVDLLKKVRGFVTIVCFVIGALITPPDVVSMCIVAIPMVVLYNISILLCKLISE